MKYCVMASLRFSTPAKSDQMGLAIKDKIAGKLTWGAVELSQGLSEEGEPGNSVEIRFDKEADMNELYDLIKDRMIQIPVLHGTVSKHPCPHDEGDGHPPCANWVEYIKE